VTSSAASSFIPHVGQGNRQVEFLVRTLAAALLVLSTSAWAARRRDDTPAQRGVLIGLAVYMFTSSLIDLHAFVKDIVGTASVPSITLRVLLGAVIVWLIPPRRTPARLCANAPATGDRRRAGHDGDASLRPRRLAFDHTLPPAEATGPDQGPLQRLRPLEPVRDRRQVVLTGSPRLVDHQLRRSLGSCERSCCLPAACICCLR
jgi:hypothetical protein